ncbi:hypothetical protein LOTGIDRAFT_175288 [Lottia gigantea]|uniref:Uncharacterized protein n=1 Tax=Lottia gigantea TaxID=225164 RepID=V4C0G3_LOTGI|nr:hypothetical protein LOTGIDRAFT_175288 [Lottia gigantea]ESO94919.1 hypothetical protein LOTGIDRAFT_175288 [Lottia gigantea]
MEKDSSRLDVTVNRCATDCGSKNKVAGLWLQQDIRSIRLWWSTNVPKATLGTKLAVGGNSIAVFTIGFDIHHLQLDDQHSTVLTDRASLYRSQVLMVRKGKSSGNLPTRNSTATIGVF